jgi:hypothetical protein
VHDEWLFPSRSRRPSDREIMDELVSFLLHGVSRPPAQSASTPTRRGRRN